MKNVYLEKRGKFYGIKFLNADGKWTHNSLGTKKAAIAKRKMQRFIDQMEKRAIRNALKIYAGNRELAAKMLGIGERTLYRKLKEYGLK